MSAVSDERKGPDERNVPDEGKGPAESKVSGEPRVVVRDRRRIDPVTGELREPATDQPEQAVEQDQGGPGAAAGGQPAAGAGDQPGGTASTAAELAAARADVAERTADLQRITAEYANYRKRVDRDRAAVVDTATRAVLAALLPVLDDVERARAHGDLTGAFKAVADQLETTLEKLGLQSFGVVGEPFDPMVHEAVAHQTSEDVSVPTCVSVLRRGFRQGERLLRAALVAVADPAPAAEPAVQPVAPSDLPAGRDHADPDAGDRPAGAQDTKVDDQPAADARPAGAAGVDPSAVWVEPAREPGDRPDPA